MANATEQAVQRLIGSGIAAPESVKGCTEAEVTRLENELGVRLPSAYRDFLRVMGHRAGKFLVGTDYCYPEVVNLQHAFRRFWGRAGAGGPFPDGAVVFLAHQGYIFLFFDARGCPDDPPVLSVTDRAPAPVQLFGRFSDWLREAVEGEIAAHQELGQ
jgi:hypothetical protein